MGNQQTLPFESEPWQTFKRQGNCTYLKNKITNEIVQKYLIHKEDQIRNQQQNLYKWRCNLNPKNHVVEVFQYGVKLPGSCQEVDQFYVITEHIQKFKRMPIMTKPQSFLFLKHIIEGLITLKPKFGLFSPTPYHIGVNKFGQGKVWINQNYAANQVQTEALVGRFQQTVVNNLCELVQTKVLNKQPNEINFPHHMNFSIALQYIEKLIQTEKAFQVKKIKTTLTLNQNNNNPQQEVTKSNNQYTDISRNTNLNFQTRTDNKNNNNTPAHPLFMIVQNRQSSMDSNHNSGSRISRNSYHSRPIQQPFSKRSGDNINKNNSLQAIPQYYNPNFSRTIQNMNIPTRTNNQPPPTFYKQPYGTINHSIPVHNYTNSSNNFYSKQIPIQRQFPKVSPTQNQYYGENKFNPPPNQQIPLQNQQYLMQKPIIQQKKDVISQQKLVKQRTIKPPLPTKQISIYSQLRIKEDIQQVNSVILIPQED